MGEGFPSGPWPPWLGTGDIPSEIGSVSLSLSVSAFLILAFHRFLYSRRSVTPIGLKLCTRFFLWILAFLQRKKGNSRLTRCRQGSGVPPALSAPQASSRVDSTSQIHKYSKNNLHQFLSHLDSVWYGYLICLQHIYNFWLFHANILQLLHTFGNFL